MPNQRHESHHRSCNIRYGTHGYLCVLPLVTLIDGFSQLGYCMLHSLGSIKNRTDLFSGFWTENKSVLFFMFINTLGMQYNITCKKPVTPPEAAVHNPKSL